MKINIIEVYRYSKYEGYTITKREGTEPEEVLFAIEVNGKYYHIADKGNDLYMEGL
mgnify:CR=1 FL=1